MPTAKVLIVDDSALMRQLLTQILNSCPELEVVGAARDPYDAWDKIKQHAPDVLTLDVEMPRMDGVAFLEKLMTAHPIPVLMVSSLTEQGCETTLRALELGAFDFVSKPKLDVREGTLKLADELVAKVLIAARSRPRPRAGSREVRHASELRPHQALMQSTHKVIAIGASTGGTEALHEVLTQLPADTPGIVIVQHMPEAFTRRFAERLDAACRIRVRQAEDGDRILPGQALIAPGGRHLEVRREGASYLVCVTDDPPVNRFRPSVDVLFHSCAKHFGKHTIAAVLTGMGCDGAAGTRALFDAGAHTIAQDKRSCVVFGMPKEAIATGGVQQICPLEGIAAALLTAASRGQPVRAERMDEAGLSA
jgi:two-component system chemotaxis response regulator CheB